MKREGGGGGHEEGRRTGRSYPRIDEGEKAEKLREVVLEGRSREEEGGRVVKPLPEGEGEARVRVFESVGFIHHQQCPLLIHQEGRVRSQAHLRSGDQHLELG